MPQVKKEPSVLTGTLIVTADDIKSVLKAHLEATYPIKITEMYSQSNGAYTIYIQVEARKPDEVKPANATSNNTGIDIS